MNKRILLLLLAVCSAWGILSASEFTGKVTTLAKSTTLAEGQWYALYNNSAQTWLTENASNGLAVQSTSPALNNSEEFTGYFVKLQSAGTGQYRIQTISGNYLAEPGNRTTSATGVAYSIQLVEGKTDQWSLQQGGKYLGGLLSSTTAPDGWTFYAVTLTTEAQLTPSQRMTYQMKRFAATDGCLVRFVNKRSSTRYLAATEKGAAKGATKTSATDLSRIWVVQPSGAGYTFLNANTGEFLTADFSATGSETRLYLQKSSNNGTTGYYYNISSKADFSGNSCLNLGTDGTSLHEWSHAGDAGSDWAAEIVHEVSMDEVRAHILGNNTYTNTLTDGAYYRIVSDSYGVAITEGSTMLRCKAVDNSNFYQYWQLKKNGSGWQLQNVTTGRYIQHQTSMSRQFMTSTSPSTFYMRSAGDAWKYTWFIDNTNNGGVGPHCDASHNVVLWATTGVPASKWLFEPVNLSAEDIANAQNAYQEYYNLYLNLPTVQQHLDNLFEDKACTTLKSQIVALSESGLEAHASYAALPQGVKQMVKKVKNNAWTLTTTTSPVTDSYEKFFRVTDYKPYSHYQEMAWRENAGQSNSYGKLSGPTGIVVNQGEVLYLYVDQAPHSDCTLQAELVTTDGAPGNHPTGVVTNLKAGLNVILAFEQSTLYIFYQLNNTQKQLADYPDIRIHIEGGTVNGAFDVTRGMKNRDWTNMRALGMMQASPVLNLKTDLLVFAMDGPEVLRAMTAAHTSAADSCEDAEKLLRIWNLIVSNQEALQGLEHLEGRYRNVWNVFSVNKSYMYATTYGTYYNTNTLSTVMNYHSLTHQQEGNEGGAIWGPSHEIGHNHQATINLIGTTESSNNMFSNINQFEQGISTTRYSSPMKNFNEYLAKGSSWNSRNIDVSTRMFFQLYLYFHEMKHDTLFLPKLFKALRQNPIQKGNWDSSLTADTNGDGTADVTGGYKSYGKDDYLKFAQTVCDVAQADLSEFFEAYGMFVPVSNQHVGDYSNYWMTTTQSDINTAKRYMKKYPKKLGNIMFIDDHIVRKRANPNNKFEGVPASDGYKVNCCTYEGSKVGTAGTMGDFELFDGHTAYESNNAYYTLSGSTISFKGTGHVGYKVYDLQGNLIWACNTTSATLPSTLRSKFPNEVVVVAAERNMKDVPCPYYKSGTSPIYKMQVSFADGTSKQWWANASIDKYLPENALAVLGSENAPEALLASTNVVNTDGTARSIRINGDSTCAIPRTIQAASLRFTKSGTGYQALNLPFALTNASTLTEGVIQKAASVAAGSPAVVENAVDYALSNATLNAGSHTATATGHALNAAGTAVEAATGISPFTYVFDSAFAVTTAVGINDLLSTPDAEKTEVYDLNGRRIHHVSQTGVYIVNGKKTLVK